jgi:hypothetical protein
MTPPRGHDAAYHVTVDVDGDAFDDAQRDVLAGDLGFVIADTTPARLTRFFTRRQATDGFEAVAADAVAAITPALHASQRICAVAVLTEEQWDARHTPPGDVGAALEHSGERLANVHDPAGCAGRACTIHNPSNHHMRAWPQHWRGDRGLVERICPHGVGHPDPDEVATDTTHGCDGCCDPGQAAGHSPDGSLAG